MDTEVVLSDSTLIIDFLRKIGFEDLLIGATAVTHSLPIATLNRQHFERIPGLKLVDLSKFKK